MAIICCVTDETSRNAEYFAGLLGASAARKEDVGVFLLELAGDLSARGCNLGPDGRKSLEQAGALAELLERLDLVRERHGTAIVGLPSAAVTEASDVFRRADFLLLPVGGSIGKLHAVGQTLESVEPHGVPSLFVVTDVSPSKAAPTSIVMALMMHGRVSPVFVPPIPGKPESASAKFTAAMDDLWAHLSKHLAKSEPPETEVSGTEASNTEASGRDRRRFTRYEPSWEVTVTVEGSEHACALRDISGGGAAIVPPVPITVGTQVVIDVPFLDRFTAEVVHAGEEKAGLRFVMDSARQWELAERLSALIDASRRETRQKRPEALVAESFAAGALDAAVESAPAVATPEGPRVIVVGNQKGGCGKTTTAMHLAVALMVEGYRVGTLDVDAAQRSFSRYMENRKATAVGKGGHYVMPVDHRTVPLGATPTHVHGLIDELCSAADIVLVDTPGALDHLTRAAHTRAHTIVTPINDSFVDLDVLAEIDAESLRLLRPSGYSELIAEIRDTRANQGETGPDWTVVRNRLSNLNSRNKQDLADLLPRLAEELGFTAAEGLAERVIFRELFLMGLTVFDVKESATGLKTAMSHIAARQEIRSLLKSLDLPEPQESPLLQAATAR